MDDNNPSFSTPAGMGGGTPDVGSSAPPQVQQQQAQPQAPQPSPQQASIAHDTLFGRAAKMLLGGSEPQYSVDANGNTVASQGPQQSGQFFKNVLAAAVLGGAAGANGPSAQGLAGGVVRGGAAGIQQQQLQDQQRRAQAQEQFQNQQKAAQEQREASAAGTTDLLRKAQIAQANAETYRTNVLTQGTDEEQHQKVADIGNQHLKVYRDAGLQPVFDDVPESQMNEILKGRPGASTFDWEPTGVKTGTDANGQPTHEYTYSAFDPKGTVNVSKPVLDQWKADGMDKYYPDLFQIMKDGKELSATQFVALKQKDQQLYNDNLQRTKDADAHAENVAKVGNYNAEAGAHAETARHDRAMEGVQAGELNLRKQELSLKQNQSGIDAKGQPTSLANDIASGHLIPERLSYLLTKNPELLAGVMKVDPTFDSAKAQAYAGVYKDFTSTKPNTAGGTLNSGGTALKHLSELQDLNTAASRIPGTAAHQKYENKVDTVAAEIAKVYGDSTIPGIAGYKATLNATFNRDAAIQTQAQSMGDKLDSLEQSWKNAAPSKAYEAPVPGLDEAAINARAKLDPKYKARLENGPHNVTPAPRPGEVPVVVNGQTVGFTMPGKTGMRPVQ